MRKEQEKIKKDLASSRLEISDFAEAINRTIGDTKKLLNGWIKWDEHYTVMAKNLIESVKGPRSIRFQGLGPRIEKAAEKHDKAFSKYVLDELEESLKKEK